MLCLCNSPLASANKYDVPDNKGDHFGGVVVRISEEHFEALRSSANPVEWEFQNFGAEGYGTKGLQNCLMVKSGDSFYLILHRLISLKGEVRLSKNKEQISIVSKSLDKNFLIIIDTNKVVLIYAALKD